jgi:hypothetical protein
MIKIFFLSCPVVAFVFNKDVINKSDAVTGRWMSTDNNLEVKIFRSGYEY